MKHLLLALAIVFSLKNVRSSDRFLGTIILLHETENILTFQDQKERDRVLLIYPDSNLAKIWSVSKQSFLSEEFVVDSECMQNTLVYAHPFLVNIDRTCHLQESGELSLVGSNEAPNGNFSFIYFSEDEPNLYFLVNGREFPGGEHGYMLAKTVNKESGHQHLATVSTHIPGYSGAMMIDRRSNLLFTAATGMNANELYSIPTDRIQELINDQNHLEFDEIAVKELGPFPGLSFRLFPAGSDELLYYNDEYESFFLSTKDGSVEKVVFPNDCKLFGVYRGEWLLNCSGKGILGLR